MVESWLQTIGRKVGGEDDGVKGGKGENERGEGAEIEWGEMECAG